MLVEVVLGFAMAAGDAAGQAYDIVINLPQQKLEQSSNYRDLIKAGSTPEEAREELAQDAANSAQLIPGVLGFHIWCNWIRKSFFCSARN